MVKSAPRMGVEGLIITHLDGETTEDVAFMSDVDEVRAVIRYYLDRAA